MPSWLSLFYEACCGCCLSEAEERSRQIDKQIFEDGRRYRSQINVLLLGTPDSGKSTFLKQARICYGQNFTSDELKELRPIIYGDILEGMQVLVNAVEKMDLEWQYPCNQVNADKILSYQRSKNIDVDTFRGYFDCLKSLWMDAAIQIAFDGRRELQMVRIHVYFNFIDLIFRSSN